MSSKSFIKYSPLMDCFPYISILSLEKLHTQNLHLVPWVIGMKLKHHCNLYLVSAMDDRYDLKLMLKEGNHSYVSSSS